jgi:hypothetical protein
MMAGIQERQQYRTFLRELDAFNQTADCLPDEFAERLYALINGAEESQ